MKTERENKRPRFTTSTNKVGSRDGNSFERRDSGFSGGRPYEKREGGSFPRREGFNRDQDGGERNGNRFDRPRTGGDQGSGNFNREFNNRPERDGNRSFDRGNGGFNRNTDRPNSFERRSGGFNNNREGGFNSNREGNSFGRPSREGGFNSNREGGFNRSGDQSRRSEGGYNRERSFDNNRSEGFERPRRTNGEGGFNSNREGNSFGRPSREGGYNQNREGGNFGRPSREGGYNSNREGGYNREGGRSFDRPNSGGGYNRERSSQGGFNRGGGARPGGSRPFNSRPTERPRPVEYKDTITDPNEPIRLNKYLANAGTCSRREADEYIQAGVVTVNGEVVTELGTKVSRFDTVLFHDQLVKLESKVYVLLNKPKDCVTTADDPQARLTVMDLVKNACKERIYPVGRLDKNTTGVLLLTNDGDLASKLMHPKFSKKKIYHVWLDRDIPKEDLEKIAEGIELEDGEIHADAISYATETDMNQVGVEIHSGRNRIVRRIFEHLGYKVVKLDRVYFAGLTKKNLQRGHWRYLTQVEVNMLRMGAFE